MPRWVCNERANPLVEAHAPSIGALVNERGAHAQNDGASMETASLAR
jgi:hypothetical protein